MGQSDGIYKACFSSSNTWNQLRTSGPQVPLSRAIWFKHATPKYSLLAWLAIQNRLSTCHRMSQWDQTVNTKCMFLVQRKLLKQRIIYSLSALIQLKFGRNKWKDFSEISMWTIGTMCCSYSRVTDSRNCINSSSDTCYSWWYTAFVMQRTNRLNGRSKNLGFFETCSWINQEFLSIASWDQLPA